MPTSVGMTRKAAQMGQSLRGLVLYQRPFVLTGGPGLFSTSWRAKARHPRLCFAAQKTWMPGPSPGMTRRVRLNGRWYYIAMPTTLTEEDKDHLGSLCMLFGVGFVLFDLNKEVPNFSIRVRAQRFFPDMFYVNKFAEDLKSYKAEIFERLF
jgi:hypothetical protein